MKHAENKNSLKECNRLFPIFIKLEKFRVLVVGGGPVAHEKLSVLLQNSPATAIKVVALDFDESLVSLAASYPNVTLIKRSFDVKDLDDIDILITALNDWNLSSQIYEQANKRNIFTNVADKPELCDFYLGSIVRKGHLKIAISTNGKSPTIARRLKEVLNEIIPDEFEELLENMQRIRQKLTGDFAAKVKELNAITKILASK